EVERHRANVLAPYARADRAPAQIELDSDRLEREPALGRVDRHVVLGLRSGRVEPLLEVAAAVEEPDPDERDAELGRALQVVAGEDAEPARVDRQSLVDAELHREVRDEQPPLGRTVGAVPPAERVGGEVDGKSESETTQYVPRPQRTRGIGALHWSTGRVP